MALLLQLRVIPTELTETSRNLIKGTDTKKPTQAGKDVWRPGRSFRAPEGTISHVWEDNAKQPIDQADYVTMPLLRDEFTTTLEHAAGILKTSHEFEGLSVSRKKAHSRKDVWSAKGGRDVAHAAPELSESSTGYERDSRRRLYLVDMHALCYDGSKVQPRKVIEWMQLLFSQVTQDNPIIAVMDGERGNEYRRALMPEYKAKRNRYRPLAKRSWRPSPACDLRGVLPLIQGFLTLCHIPVVKLEMAEADDVVATLARQARERGLQVVVASPDMDFRQLLAPDVHMLLPLPEFGRWSFYTLQHYITQNQVTPDLDLGLRCLLGDSTDNIPGLMELVPGFGRKTAMKLMQKHKSLEALLTAAATRTVGKNYIQDALTQHADLLRRNFQVLSLRTDVRVVLKEQWCRPRSNVNDVLAFELLDEKLQTMVPSPISL